MGLISRVSSRTYRLKLDHSTMRTEICQFSGLKIYPGHGKSYVRFDGKKVILINGKSEKLLKAKKNPRKVTWTILYRRKHKKGTMTEIDARKRRRRPRLTRRSRRRRCPPSRRRRLPSRRTRREARAPAESVARGRR